MQVPATVAHLTRANAGVSCPLCGSLPVDESGTCPAGGCPLYGLSTSSPVSRKRAAAWQAGERPWRQSP